MLEQVAISYSRASSRSRDGTHIAGRFFRGSGLINQTFVSSRIQVVAFQLDLASGSVFFDS